MPHDDLEQRVHQLELDVSNHIAASSERGKRIEGTLEDIKARLNAEHEPKTLYGFALRFVGKYGLGGAAMVLLGIVLWWAHVERTSTRQQATKKIEQLQSTIEAATKGPLP